MNKISMIAVALAAVLAAGGAAAESPMPEQYPLAAPAGAGLTREQVRAELMQARADGSMKVWSTQYDPFIAMRATKTRDEVRAELLAARASGTVDAFTGEDSGSAYLARRSQPASGGDTRLAGSPQRAQ